MQPAIRRFDLHIRNCGRYHSLERFFPSDPLADPDEPYAAH
jgi:hypothetical protein